MRHARVDPDGVVLAAVHVAQGQQALRLEVELADQDESRGVRGRRQTDVGGGVAGVDDGDRDAVVRGRAGLAAERGRGRVLLTPDDEQDRAGGFDNVYSYVLLRGLKHATPWSASCTRVPSISGQTSP